MTSFDALPGHVWPRTACRADSGEVEIAGVSLAALAAEYGTPLFVVDEEDFRSRCRDMAAAFGGGEHVHYASKAFLTRRIAQWVCEEGLSLDIASENELRVALAADFPPERITAHGNNKSDSFLELCVAAGVGHVVLDNHEEIARLSRIASAAGRIQPVLVRVKPGVEAHTHEMIATAHEDQKFGFSLASGSALRAAKETINAAGLSLVGLHCHVGSQVFDAAGFSLAAERVLALMEDILSEHPDSAAAFKILDLGGGYGIAYTADQQPLDVHAVAEDLKAKVRASAEALGLHTPDIMVEPGRAIVGPSTVTVYRVGAVKDVTVSDTQSRRYVAVDGGMSDNIRPALYGAEYDIRLVNRLAESGEVLSSRVVGSHCESGDILCNSVNLPASVCSGDLLALAATGAYCYAMSSNYNMFARPAVVSVRDGQATLMLRRQTVEDFLALEG
ncbi:diaminopimelate decarboxylase [Staphylococcus chromogenes]|nr:diaminopimelate decarboxylase [Staphylococcus chromogenes]